MIRDIYVVALIPNYKSNRPLIVIGYLVIQFEGVNKSNRPLIVIGYLVIQFEGLNKSNRLLIFIGYLIKQFEGLSLILYRAMGKNMGIVKKEGPMS